MAVILSRSQGVNVFIIVVPTGCSQSRMHMKRSDSFSIWFRKCWIGGSWMMFIHYCIGWLSRNFRFNLLRYYIQHFNNNGRKWIRYHYNDVIMTTMASQITTLTVVYSTVYSDADQRKHQSSASLAFVWGIHRDRWIPRTKGQSRGKCFHLMTSSCLESRASYGVYIVRNLENG